MSLLGNIVSGIGSVASLVPGIGNLAGAGLNALGGALGASINQADDRSYAQQLWDKQNAYNDPSAQVERLKKAGLNPNMVFGQVGSSGSATTMPDSVKVSDSNSQNHFMDQLSSMMMIQANTANINAQAEKAKADAHLADVNAKKLGGVDTSNVEASTANLTADANLKRSQFVAQDMTNRINATLQEPRMSAEIANLVSQTLKNNADRDLAKKNLTKVAQDIIESAARTANYKIQTYQMSRLTPLLAAKLGAEIDLTDANTTGVGYDNALKGEDYKFRNTPVDKYGRYSYTRNLGNMVRNFHFGEQQLDYKSYPWKKLTDMFKGSVNPASLTPLAY